MANGDLAAAAGYATVPSTKDLRIGYDDINLTRDYVASLQTALDTRLDTLEGAAPWITYTPIMTNFNLGTGGVKRTEYRVDGKEVTVRFNAKIGTAGWSLNNPLISLPIAMATPTVSVPYEYFGGGTLYSGNIFPLFVMRAGNSLTNAAIYAIGVTGAGYQNVTNSAPKVIQAGDAISLQFSYRIA